MTISLQELFACLLDPWLFLWVSACHIPSTIRELIAVGGLRAVLSPSRFRWALFGQFWATVGPEVKASAKEVVIPLLEGYVGAGKVHQDRVGPPIDGVVMEIGAGSGMWADVLAGINEGQKQNSRGEYRESRVTKIYGIEPHPASRAELQRRVRSAGLDEIYEIIPAGIESLSNGEWSSIKPESMDCIMSILCLCSIPDQQINIARLYQLLKPGGRWYIYEHVKVERGGILLNMYQYIVNIFWSFFVGSCRLRHSTRNNLRNAGPWHKFDLEKPAKEPAYVVLPHIVGVLEK